MQCSPFRDSIISLKFKVENPENQQGKPSNSILGELEKKVIEFVIKEKCMKELVL